MTYRIRGLPSSPFRPLFALDDAALQARGLRRLTAHEPHSAPCRVSLTDAEPGERLILLTYRHLDAPASPYRSEGPILVREAAVEAALEPGRSPDMLTRRLLSARVYDSEWMMTDADVLEGDDLDGRLRAWFAEPGTTQVHLHTARRGCFLAAAIRDQ